MVDQLGASDYAETLGRSAVRCQDQQGKKKLGIKKEDCFHLCLYIHWGALESYFPAPVEPFKNAKQKSFPTQSFRVIYGHNKIRIFKFVDIH